MRSPGCDDAHQREALLAGRAMLVGVIESAQKDALRCIDLDGRPNYVARSARDWFNAETDPRLETLYRQAGFVFAPPPRTSQLTFDFCCAELENWYPAWFGDWEALRRRILARIDAAWMHYRLTVVRAGASELQWPEPARPDDPQDLRLLVQARGRRLLKSIARRQTPLWDRLPLFARALDREREQAVAVVL